MIWVTWRQSRTEGFIVLGVLALGTLYLVITGLIVSHDYQQSGLRDCVAHHALTTPACGALKEAFLNQYGSLIYVAAGLLLLPILFGPLVGVPLVAREYEQHTHLLVWMQSITRTRWLTVKLLVVLGAGALAAGGLMELLIWWFSPFSPLIGSFNFVAFDFSGPVLIASTVLALAVGIMAGALTRQSVSAIFLALALIVAIRIGVEFNWRLNYQPPITVTWPLKTLNDPAPITLGIQDWNVGEGWIDGQGNKTDGISCNGGGDQTPLQCAQADGFRDNYLSYQPADRFWPFQWIETSIYLAISGLAIGATVWVVRRRMS